MAATIDSERAAGSNGESTTVTCRSEANPTATGGSDVLRAEGSDSQAVLSVAGSINGRYADRCINQASASVSVILAVECAPAMIV